jgi:hypothetical protein
VRWGHGCRRRNQRLHDHGVQAFRPFALWRDGVTAGEATYFADFERMRSTASPGTRRDTSRMRQRSRMQITITGLVAVPQPTDRNLVFALNGVWPNPGDSRVQVSLELPSWVLAELDLYDLAGRRVAHRGVGSLGPGQHLVALGDGAHVRPGVYFVRLRQGQLVGVKRIVVTR